MSAATAAGAGRPRRLPAGLLGVARSVLINLVAPSLLFRLAATWFAHDSPLPLLLCAAIPAADLGLVFWRRRSVDVIAIISLVQFAVGILITLVTHSARLALELHALQAGALGLVFAGSLIIDRPLIQPLARQSMAGDDAEKQARFDEHATRPAVRRVFRVMTLVWAVGLVAQSAVLFIACRRLPPASYIMVANIVGYGVNGTMIWGSIRYGRWRRARVANARAVTAGDA